MDRVTNETSASIPSASASGQPVVHAALIGAATLACLIAVGLGVGAFHRNGYAKNHIGTSHPSAHEKSGKSQDHVIPQQTPPVDIFNKLLLFQGWDRPSVVLVLSGQQQGYLQPCGCSTPQFGGLARRSNLFLEMRKRGWPIVAADLGDINQKKGPKDLPSPQSTLKFIYAMKSLDAMGYTAVNFGEYETSMPLAEALGHYALNNPTPKVIAANLMDREAGKPFHGMNVFDWALADKHVGPKVGFFGLIGPTAEKKVRDPSVRFNPNSGQIVLDCLKELKKNKADLVVLLYQGDAEEAKACSDFCAKASSRDNSLSRLDVILCISGEKEAEPPAMPIMAGNTMIVQVGHKGRNVGVIGAFSAKGTAPFQLKYQLVSIGPEFDTPAGLEKSHKVMELMEQYTAELKRDNYLAKFKQITHPVQVDFPKSSYVGSQACFDCHKKAYKIWEDSGHSHAYQKLVDAKNPSLRQFDGECVICHTDGFGYKTGFENYTKTPHLTDVGCESCHGPGSEHIKQQHNQAIHLLINPFKWPGKNPPDAAQQNARQLQIGSFCQKCHDLDNDNHFLFNVKWPKIVHMNK